MHSFAILQLSVGVRWLLAYVAVRLMVVGESGRSVLFVPYAMRLLG